MERDEEMRSYKGRRRAKYREKEREIERGGERDRDTEIVKDSY